MNLWENIRMALGGLRANKMRAILTMLGIIIGIASVIAIVTVGNALTASVSGCSPIWAPTRSRLAWRTVRTKMAIPTGPAVGRAPI